MPDNKHFTPLLLEAEYDLIQKKWPENFPKTHAVWSQDQADKNNRLRKSGFNVIAVQISFSGIESHVRMLSIPTVGDLELEDYADVVGRRPNIP